MLRRPPMIAHIYAILHYPHCRVPLARLPARLCIHAAQVTAEGISASGAGEAGGCLLQLQEWAKQRRAIAQANHVQVLPILRQRVIKGAWGFLGSTAHLFPVHSQYNTNTESANP